MTEWSNLLWLAGVVAFWAGPCLLLMHISDRKHAKRRSTAAQSGSSSGSYGTSSVSVMDGGMSSTTGCDTHHVC